MEKLPAVRPETHLSTPRSRKLRKLILKGWSASEIANAVFPNEEDKKKRKIIRNQVRSIIAHDEEIQAMNALVAKGTLIEDMPEIVEAVGRRAKKGNIPAAKLAMEASGFHNPRIQHDHSGEIQITIKGMDRPERTVDEDEVVDAEVVEDDVE